MSTTRVASPSGGELGGGAGEMITRVQRVGLNEVNVVTMAAGLLLHRSPREYVAAVEDAAPGGAGVIALLLGCLGADLLYSPHLAATLFWLAGQTKNPTECDEPPRPPNPEFPASEAPATKPESGPQ